MHIFLFGVGLGWGGVEVITFMSTWTHMHCMVCKGLQYASLSFGVGLGWGGGNNVHGNLNIRPATLWNLLLHLRTYVLLRCGSFSCTCAQTSCYAVGSSLALAHIRPATLWDLLLHLRTYVMLRCGIFSCTCAHTSCYAVGSSLALAHIRHATLWDLLLHLRTYVMLRCGIFSCTCAHTSCYAVGSSDRNCFLHRLCVGLLYNFDLNLLISMAALELQLSKRCPTWPHPRHVRGIRS